MVLFSVSPSQRPTGTFVPSVQIASATTQQASAKCTPSSINAASLSSDRSRLINSSSPAWVAVLNRRLTDDRDVDRALAASCSPTGSFTRAWRRVATPASIRSITSSDSRSSLVKGA
jgi:hypothetical protein